MVFPEDIDSLHSALQPILRAELSAGNVVVETWRGWPKRDSLFVMLQRPFAKCYTPFPAGVIFRNINDPHHWKAEFVHESSHHVLACRFGAH